MGDLFLKDRIGKERGAHYARMVTHVIQQVRSEFQWVVSIVSQLPALDTAVSGLFWVSNFMFSSGSEGVNMAIFYHEMKSPMEILAPSASGIKGL